MEEPGKIFEAIPAVMAEIDAIGKNRKNQQQGFNYRGVDDVMNAINPALTKHHIFIVPNILEQIREQRESSRGALLNYSICKIQFRFYAEDGSWVEAVTIGEGMDSGDKATNKAMSVAFKYACFQVFCIPTEEMKDPDAEDPMLQGPEPKEQKEPKKPDDSKQQIMQTAIRAVDVATLKNCMNKKGVSESAILKRYKKENVEKLNFAEFQNAMNILNKIADK